MTPNDQEWLALLLVTESARPDEWNEIAWVVRNRIDSPRFPETVAGVVLQPRQFSFFNDFGGASGEVYAAARERLDGSLYAEALAFAADHETHSRRWEAPFGRHVVNYWSPRSMVPAGSLPPWNFGGMRCFHVDDPWRFVFAELVSDRHPESGNAELYNYAPEVTA